MKNSSYTFKLIDGQKAVRLEDLPPEAWRVITGEAVGNESKLEKLYRSVPWLARGVNIRASAMAKMPFTIYDGENEFDTSVNYQNKLGWWPNPDATLSLTEASLALVGRAYLFKVRANLNIIQNLRYLVPTSITPKFHEDIGLTGFERRLPSGVKKIPIENMVWFWVRDAFTEIGPPPSSPAKEAMRAAGVLFNVDTFVEAFFERGAIKASILAAPTAIGKGSRDELKGWWRKVVTGVKNAWASNVLNADTVKVVTVGEGIAELSNTELTKEKREDISVALGVPQNILFSDEANFATAKQEDFRLYDLTINSEAKFIQGGLNTLLLNPIGYSIKFHPETLQVSQQEETLRSGALVNLERANIPPWLGMGILGYDLPPGVEESDIEEQIREYMVYKSSLRIPSSNDDQSPVSAENPTSIQRSVLDEYLRHALKRHKGKKPIKGTKGAPPFDHEGLVSDGLIRSIGEALDSAKDEKEITKIFENAKQWENYP